MFWQNCNNEKYIYNILKTFYYINCNQVRLFKQICWHLVKKKNYLIKGNFPDL